MIAIDWLRRAAEWIAAAIFAVMFGVFLIQVFTRYLLNDPAGWTFEVAVVAYIWTVFWACAFLLKERDHVAFNMFYLAAPPPGRRILLIIGVGCLFVALVASMPKTIDFVTFMAIEKTPLLRWRFDYIYSVYILFAVAVIVRSGLLLVRLFGPRWRQAVAEGGGLETLS